MQKPPVHLTEAAIREISSIVVQKKIPEGFGLRIGTRGGGCSGVQYFIGFDSGKEGDDRFDFDGFQVFIEKKHFLHLAGMKVDFVEEESQRGFFFEPV